MDGCSNGSILDAHSQHRIIFTRNLTNKYGWSENQEVWEEHHYKPASGEWQTMTERTYHSETTRLGDVKDTNAGRECHVFVLIQGALRFALYVCAVIHDSHLPNPCWCPKLIMCGG